MSLKRAPWPIERVWVRNGCERMAVEVRISFKRAPCPSDAREVYLLSNVDIESSSAASWLNTSSNYSASKAWFMCVMVLFYVLLIRTYEWSADTSRMARDGLATLSTSNKACVSMARDELTTPKCLMGQTSRNIQEFLYHRQLDEVCDN